MPECQTSKPDAIPKTAQGRLTEPCSSDGMWTKRGPARGCRVAQLQLVPDNLGKVRSGERRLWAFSRWSPWHRCSRSQAPARCRLDERRAARVVAFAVAVAWVRISCYALFSQSSSPRTMTGRFAGSNHWEMERARASGTATHPAVAPLPCTCRKMPLPAERFGCGSDDGRVPYRGRLNSITQEYLYGARKSQRCSA